MSSPPAAPPEVFRVTRGVRVVKRGDGGFQIIWRWWNVRRFILGTLLYMGSAAFLLIDDPIFRSVNPFSILLAGMPLWGVYLNSALLLNSTLITADGEFLRVSHGPVPWFGRREVAVKDIAGLHAGCETHTGLFSNAKMRTFRLWAKLAGGERQVLVNGPIDGYQAEAIKEVLERHLGIASS